MIFKTGGKLVPVRRYIILLVFILICFVAFSIVLSIKNINTKNYLKNEVFKARTFLNSLSLKEEPKTTSAVEFQARNGGTQKINENYIDYA